MPELDLLRSPRTVAIIGCGKLGTAIVEGFLNSTNGHQMSHLILTAGSEAGTARLVAKFGGGKPTQTPKITILQAKQNGQAASQASHIILACKHGEFRQVLREESLYRALTTSCESRVLINVMGGVTTSEIEEILHLQDNDNNNIKNVAPATKPLILMRAMPNIAARLNQSTTALACLPSLGLDPEVAAGRTGIELIFGLVGTVQWLPENLMNTASALCASSLAFYASVIEGMASGAQFEPDMQPEIALALAASAARSTAALLMDGMAPEDLRKAVTTKGGSTESGQEVMDGRMVQRAMREVVRTTALVAKGLTKMTE